MTDNKPTSFAAVFAAPTVEVPEWGKLVLPASRVAESFIPTMQEVNRQIDLVLLQNEQFKLLDAQRSDRFVRPPEAESALHDMQQSMDRVLLLMRKELPHMPPTADPNSDIKQHVKAVLDIKRHELDQAVQWRLEDHPSEMSLMSMPLKILVEMLRVHRLMLNATTMPEFKDFLVSYNKLIVD